VAVYKTSNSGLLTRREYTSFLAGNSQFIPWEPSGAYDSIATTTVGAGGAASVTFSSIPSTYTHLQIRMMGKAVDTNIEQYNPRLRFNSDTGANYTVHYFRGYGTTVGAGAVTGSDGAYCGISTFPSSNAVYANVFGSTVVDILDYTNTSKNKIIRFNQVDEKNISLLKTKWDFFNAGYV
jgi:hypothetical protein